MKSRIELFGKLSRMIFEMLFVMLITIFFENVLLKQEPGVLNRVILLLLYLASFVVRNVAGMRIVALISHVAVGAFLFALGILSELRTLLPPSCGWSPSLRREASTQRIRRKKFLFLTRFFEGSLLRALSAKLTEGVQHSGLIRCSSK